MARYTCFTWQYFTILGLWFFILPTLSLAQQSYITQTRSFSVPFPVEDIAISADEALIAVALKPHASDLYVQIYDRQSQKPLLQIASERKAIQQIQFDPYSRKLALVDSEYIQIWDLNEFPIQPNQPLSSKNLIAEIKHSLQPNSEIKFSKQASALLWGADNHLQKLSLSQKPLQTTSLWVGAPHSPQQFSFDAHGKWLAYSLANNNRIYLANPYLKQTKPHLDYHHFPVVGVEFVHPEHLLSLDTEKNLIWGNINNRVKTHGLFLKNLAPEERTQGFQTIYQDQFLAVLAQNSSTSKIFAYILDKNGTQLHKMPLVNLKSLTSSPTGAYMLAASSPKKVDIYQLQPHQPPLDYIRHLENKGALEMARHYRNHLEALPINLSIVEPPLTLKTLVDHLKIAMRLEKWKEAQQWVTKIMEQHPKNPDALSAKKILDQHQDLVLLEQGKEELQKENFNQGIRVLAQIPKTSAYHLEAWQLIAEAEQKKQLQQAFEKSKQEVRLKNWAKAKALLLPVIAQNPDHQAAQDLLDKIENQEFLFGIFNFMIVLVCLGLLAGLALVAIKKRQQIIDWLSLNEQEAPPLKPPLRKKNKPPSSDKSPEKQLFLEALEKTKTVIELTKKADRTGKYTAKLIDFEAEIAVICKKANQPEASYPHLSNQLFNMLQTIRKFHFESEQKSSASHAQSDSRQSHKPQMPPAAQAIPNYYQILNIAPNASFQEIKRAYHEQMKAYHPDLHQNSGFDWVRQEAETKTRLIQQAYDTLKNQQSRQEYDKTIQ